MTSIWKFERTQKKEAHYLDKLQEWNLSERKLRYVSEYTKAGSLAECKIRD